MSVIPENINFLIDSEIMPLLEDLEKKRLSEASANKRSWNFAIPAAVAAGIISFYFDLGQLTGISSFFGWTLYPLMGMFAAVLVRKFMNRNLEITDFHSILKEKVIRRLLTEVNPELEYSPEQFVTEEKFLASGFYTNILKGSSSQPAENNSAKENNEDDDPVISVKITRGSVHFTGEDHVKGKMDGVDFEFSEVGSFNHHENTALRECPAFFLRQIFIRISTAKLLLQQILQKILLEAW